MANLFVHIWDNYAELRIGMISSRVDSPSTGQPNTIKSPTVGQGQKALRPHDRSTNLPDCWHLVFTNASDYEAQQFETDAGNDRNAAFKENSLSAVIKNPFSLVAKGLQRCLPKVGVGQHDIGKILSWWNCQDLYKYCDAFKTWINQNPLCGYTAR
jgi:hypothetical protein